MLAGFQEVYKQEIIWYENKHWIKMFFSEWEKKVAEPKYHEIIFNMASGTKFL